MIEPLLTDKRTEKLFVILGFVAVFYAIFYTIVQVSYAILG